MKNKKKNAASVSGKDIKSKTPVSRKVFTILGIVLCAILLPILILNIFLIIVGMTTDKSSMPNIGGYFPLIVQSGSMGGTIEEGDLIFVHTVEDDSKKDMKKDDIVTFWDKEVGGPLVTHRIIDTETDKDGNLVYVTKGDANPAQDHQRLYPEKIVAYYCSRIPYLGSIAMFMQTIPGLIICVILPLGLFIIYDIIRKRTSASASQLENERLLAELNELKRQQALSSSSEQQNSNSQTSQTTSSSEAENVAEETHDSSGTDADENSISSKDTAEDNGQAT